MKSLAELQLRFASHYEEVMRRINELYLDGGEGLNLALQLYDLEKENIEAGWSFALATAEENDQAAVLCSSYPRVGASLLNMRLPPRERVRRSQAALRAASRLSDRQAQSRHLGDLATAFVSLGDTERAIECLQQQLEQARVDHDLRGSASALGNLGNAAMAQKDPRQAIDYYQQALSLYRQLGQKRSEADALNNLGVAYKDLGEWDTSLESHQQGLQICREISYRRGEGQALNNIAIVNRKMRKHQEAMAVTSEALQIFREVGDLLGQAQALWSMAKTFSELGNYEAAVTVGETALSFFERLEARQAARVKHQLDNFRTLADAAKKH
jgi:tetratricopeptide (TPR) repeat protein